MFAFLFTRLSGRAPAASSDRDRLAAARVAVNLSHRLLQGDVAAEAPWVAARTALLLDAEALRLSRPADVEGLPDAVEHALAARDSLGPERLIEASRRAHELALRELDAGEARLDPRGPPRRRATAAAALGGCAVALAAVGWHLAPRLRPDVAAAAVWTASGVEAGYAASGVGASSVGTAQHMFFHTDKQDDPWIRFDLPARPAVGYVEVTNRGDCCLERAVPLVVEGDPGDGRWRELATRTTAFYRWSATFPRQRLVALRLRAHGNTWLHLSVVEIR